MIVCEQCEGELETRTATAEEPYQYTASGIDHVYLIDIDVYRCSTCQREAPRIPRISALHSALNDAIAMLSGLELRFLRKHRGASQKEMARRLRVEPETLSRIENGHEQCGQALENLMRFIARDGMEECNAYDLLGTLADQAIGEKNHSLNLVHTEQAWELARD